MVLCVERKRRNVRGSGSRLPCHGSHSCIWQHQETQNQKGTKTKQTKKGKPSKEKEDSINVLFRLTLDLKDSKLGSRSASEDIGAEANIISNIELRYIATTIQVR